MPPLATRAVAAVLGAAVVIAAARAGDQPQWGARLSRNMVSEEKGLPATFDPATGGNLAWTAALGTQTFSTPVVSGGCVLIGTNNGRPRDPNQRGDRGVLLCLDEKTGRLRWQLVVPKRSESPFLDWPDTGMVSPAAVEGRHAYMVTNRDEVACLDLGGLADGNAGPYVDEARHAAPAGTLAGSPGTTDADIVWLLDLPSQAAVRPHDAAHANPLLLGPLLYTCTSNGVDDTHLKMPAPDAPSLVAVDRSTGRLVARDEEGIGHRMIHNTWSSPSAGVVGGRTLVFFGGGDGVCYAFDAVGEVPAAGDVRTLRRVWRFDCDPDSPKTDIYRWQDNRKAGPSIICGMPVFEGGRVYVAAGGDIWHGKPWSWLKCIDAAGTGDITRSAQVWSYRMSSHCVATPSVRDGLVYIADAGGTIHCLDAATGRPCWTHDTNAEVWGSTLVADGRVYVGTRRGDLWVLAAGRQKRVLGTVHLDGPINGTPVAANGRLYVATMRTLYAARRGARLPRPAP